MKKTILSIAVLAFGITSSFAQTTATDFTATDCSSGSHNLFTELNNGKVVVMVWVMPCAACISDAKAAYDVVQTFATSNPGKVLYWISDDAGNTDCTSLSGWASTNSIGPSGMTLFGNTGNTIDESNYGGSAMPHVVVMGGVNHHIYYNQKNGSNDGAAITNAINQALAATSVTNVSIQAADLSLFPNPAKNKITVNYNLPQSTPVLIEITDITGKKVKTLDLSAQLEGKHAVTIDFANELAGGIYILKLTTGSTTQIEKFSIED